MSYSLCWVWTLKERNGIRIESHIDVKAINPTIIINVKFKEGLLTNSFKIDPIVTIINTGQVSKSRKREQKELFNPIQTALVVVEPRASDWVDFKHS